MSEKQDCFLIMKNISKNFAGVKALKNVDFSINKSEIHGLVGENGSGKSTLIKIISGVLQPDEISEISIDGQEYQRYNVNDIIKKGIQVIYQESSIFPNLTVAENIAFNQTVEKARKFINWKELTNSAKRAMSKINIDLDPSALVEDLSLANQILIAICRVLTTDAKLIIMDEPTSALTNKDVELLFRVIENLKNQGLSIIFVSHKLEEVLKITDRITILRDGVKIGTYNTEDLDYDELIYLMTGKKISDFRYSFDEENKRIMVEVKNISKRNNYKDISFKLHEGEILGFYGLLGSGRTETVQALFGLNNPETGEIFIDNKLSHINSPTKAVEAGISYVPEDRINQGLVMTHSIGDNIIITILKKLLNRIKLISTIRKERQINNGIKQFNIKCASYDNPVQTLSGGNQQRVVLAKWLATDPKILILDNPTAGIDVAAKDDIHRNIKELAKKGMGVILVSDEEKEILNNCNRLILMHKGKILKDMKIDDTVNKILN